MTPNVKTSPTSRRLMHDVLAVLAQLCASHYHAAKDDVDMTGNISDKTLRQIAPTTNDVAVAIGNINVYQARRLLLKLVDEGAVIKTGTSKGLPLHWWLVGANKKSVVSLP